MGNSDNNTNGEEISYMSSCEKKACLRDLKNKLDQGENIVSILTDNRTKDTSAEDEMISYDLRAGGDLADYEKNPSFRDDMASEISKYIKKTGIVNGNIVECGSGEGLNLSLLLNDVELKFTRAIGFDISWSRNKIAQNFSHKYTRTDVDVDFMIGDFFNLPLGDSSVDMLFTMQGIYAMGGREEVVLKEFFRVAKEYIVLIEPTYELAGQEARERMDKLGYVKNLPMIADKLGGEIICHELFQLNSNPLNPAAVIIIRKRNVENSNSDFLCCPITKTKLEKISDVYYSREAMLSYPVISGVASLLKDSAVVSTHLLDYC